MTHTFDSLVALADDFATVNAKYAINNAVVSIGDVAAARTAFRSALHEVITERLELATQLALESSQVQKLRDAQTTNFLRERAQLDREWSILRGLEADAKAAAGAHQRDIDALCLERDTLAQHAVELRSYIEAANSQREIALRALEQVWPADSKSTSRLGIAKDELGVPYGPPHVTPMTFGGCPECGKASCVARECTRPLPAQDVNAELAYNKVDRFLRNNLGDDDYAEYSEALDTLANAKAAQQKGQS